MAKQYRPTNTGKTEQHTFDKDLVEDVSGIHLQPNSWTQARNAVPNTVKGDLGGLSNEQSNFLCLNAPYTIIGAIHLDGDRWIIFSTDNTNSEIGIFNFDTCQYTTVVNAACLNFSTLNLIIGVSKENFDCTWQIYWDDGNNPSRTLNIDNVPWIQDCTTDPSGCVTCVDTDQLDCDAIRLAPLVKNPCLKVAAGIAGGELLNGSYFAVGAYVVNGQKVTDYSTPSNVQGLFSHSNIAGSLDIFIEEMDENFDEFELVVVRIVNEQTVAKKIGVYSTRQNKITIDIIDERYPTIDFGEISLRNPIVDSSDAMYRNGDYLIRVGPCDKFDFNYQPLANQINTQWVCTEYPAYYYGNGGNNVGYLRDEVYPFFIRFVWDTGDKTASYHIPGRIIAPGENVIVGGDDATPETSVGESSNLWKVINTASVTSAPNTALPDGGVVIAKGKMAYWESTERYDDDTPQIWNSTYIDPQTNVNIGNTTNTQFDLCGRQIRHHKFPSTAIYNLAGSPISSVTSHYNPSNSERIRIMGVQFSNIKPPVDNDGIIIPNIVGYEILRGSREGNKSIIAKGMLNNMRAYTIPGGITNRTGLYPNYPYNPQNTNDNFHVVNKGTSNPLLSAPLSKYHYTFHSPDTNFKDPFLSAKQLDVYNEMRANVIGEFSVPSKHPEHKLITDFAFLASVLGGVAYMILKRKGTTKTTYVGPRALNTGASQLGFFGGVAGGGTWYGAAPAYGAGNLSIPQPGGFQEIATGAADSAAQVAYIANVQGFVGAAEAFIGLGDTALPIALNLANRTPMLASVGYMGGYTTQERQGGENSNVPAIIKVLAAVPSFVADVGEGSDILLNIIRGLSPFVQYALQYQSHGFYSGYAFAQPDEKRRVISDSIYVDPYIQNFGANYEINNLNRQRTVALEITKDLELPTGTDNTQFVQANVNDPTKDKKLSYASSYYVGLKQRLRNQYGQIRGIVQVPVSFCATDISQTTSDVLFGGDTYIGRYTEKNAMPFFTNWLYGQPNGEEFNYNLYNNLPYTRFWADFHEFDFNEFIQNLFTAITTFDFTSIANGSLFPSALHELDGSGTDFFTKKNKYFYLFYNGVRDFFVESEVNVDFRDWGENDEQRHYDIRSYTDLKKMFDSAIITRGNYYKYDYSLSIARLYTNLVSWGNVQAIDYDPQIAEDCFVCRPNRVIYSLPQNIENKKDYWKVFLPLNFRDFRSRVTAIKPVNKNGALILFENESPAEFKGVDILQTGSGNKITIGDGGLFSQPFQNVLNTDDPYEYGSCQNRLSVINTASGIFWMSQNQGKIFQLGNGVKELSAFDMKWWLSTYLPYKLTEDFPDFELKDNPVAGIGCQAIYDNERQIVYFCKKDYQLRKDIADKVTYVGTADDFLVNGMLPIKLGNPSYFEDASWTISYDPKANEGNGAWISYHDWHPDLLIPGKVNFSSTKGSGVWKHNYVCDSYCNFYGIDYPFEVEWATVTPQIVNTLRSVEYYMEVYKYNENCYDRFHVLDFNFDEAVIYNSEQNSGLLKLNLNPKNNAPGILNYPQINPNSIDILYSKEEQKYRFNQFWDITADRGEFNAAAERSMWNTEANGYVRNLNPNNLDYDKLQTERKKFRHYKNTVLLRRNVCGNRNMIISLSNNKNLMSPR